MSFNFSCEGTKTGGIGIDNTCASGNTLAAGFLSGLGKDHILVGGSMAENVANAAPYDVRYLYLAGGLFDGTDPCGICTSCTTTSVAPPGTHSCANADGGCAWWGCWQDDTKSPGLYALNFIASCKTNNQIPMITYYELLQASYVAEGQPEVTDAATNTSFMHRFLSDWHFLLEKIGSDTVFLHIEPDFWGYAEQYNSDPTLIPAAVESTGFEHTSTNNNTIAGLGKCLIDMVHTHCPNAKVGLHASPWSTGYDCVNNNDSQLDVAAEAQKTAAFLLACGADADFVVADIADRDAATSGHWWNTTNQTLPNFTQAYSWLKALGAAMSKPVLLWQVPVGTGAKDNRLDYYFGHMYELADANVAAVLFGAGAGNETTPSTDGGNMANKTKAYIAAGGQKPCR
jgi:hypothetical protein